MKKKLLALLVIGSAVVASSCNKIKEATNQNITLTTADVTLDIASKGASATEIEISSASKVADLDNLIKSKASGFGLKNVKSLKIKTLTAEITAGSDATNSFSNLNGINATLEGGGKTFIASYTGTPPAPGTKINLTVDSSVDLKDLLSGSTVKYTLKSKIATALTKNLTVKLVATYDAVVGL
jgi:hypothetical protein